MSDRAGQGAASRFAALRLIRTPRVGPVSFRSLIERFGTAEAALEALPDLALRGGGRAPVIPSRDTIEAEIAAVRALGARYLIWGDPLYPRLLAETDSAPPALIVKGRLNILDRPAVALVGARNASAAGGRMARELGAALAEAGQAVVSGLARGIDTQAHEGARARGDTIAVIASGIDVAFPPENAALQEALGTEQLVIAEQPVGTQPLARHFPSRNRIIAGLAAGTVVVEAAPRSGSLITARLAAEMGREVMAVPGSPLDPRAQGCNLLIREGATLVQSAEDVLEVLRGFGAMVAAPRAVWTPAPVSAEAGEAERRAVTALLGPVPVGVDELVRQAGLPPAIVQTVLLELELAGRLSRHAGGRVALA